MADRPLSLNGAFFFFSLQAPHISVAGTTVFAPVSIPREGGAEFRLELISPA